MISWNHEIIYDIHGLNISDDIILFKNEIIA